MKETARKYLKLKLNPVPLGVDKAAIRMGHSNIRITEEELDNFKWERIGVSTGSVSAGLEALDFDLKNTDKPAQVFNTFCSKVSDEVLKKVMLIQTPSGGYHMLYRCQEVGSSQHLAKGENGKAVIETRGEGSYVATYPTEGYEIIQGSYEDIPILDPEERLELFVSARMLDRKLETDLSRNKNVHTDFLDKFPSYDKDIKIGIGLLEDAGWTIQSEDDVWVNMTRPGKTSGISGGYNKELKFFYCFTTSTDFEENKPYNNHALFAELKCHGRYDIAYAKLYEAGHGAIDKEDLQEVGWDYRLKNLLFLSSESEEAEYIELAAEGKIEQGLRTGWPSLDKYFRWKKNTVNMGLGYDGTGKSFFMLSGALATNLLHNWKWGIVAPENKPAMNRRRLLEMRSGISIEELKKYPEYYKKYSDEIYNNFYIAGNDYYYSLEDAFDIGARLYEEYGIDALLIDPWNFFKVPIQDSYRWNNLILSKARVFAQKYCSVYMMAHPRSETTRTNLDKQGYLMSPSPYSIQGGADFSYRVDDFFTFHRIKKHPDEEIRTTLQFIMTKLKENETGGRVHDHGDYTSLRWQTRNGFTGYWDVNGENPMYRYLTGETDKSIVVPMKPSIEIFE